MLRYLFPDDFARDPRFRLTVTGEPMDVFATDGDAFARFAVDGPARIEVELPEGYDAPVVRPLRHGIEGIRDENKLSFTIPGPINLRIDFGPALGLFLYVDPVDLPGPDPAARVFAAGRIHDEGEVLLEPYQSLYLEPGAVLRGRIAAPKADGVLIHGPGVLDGGYYAERGEHVRSLVLENGSRAAIRDLLMIRPTSWMVVVGGCDSVEIQGLRQIGHVLSSDGIDVVGSRRVHISDCMLRNGDDCVVVKSLDLSEHDPRIHSDMTLDVEDVLVERCVFYNDKGGSAMEIGYELRCDSVRNIRFRDIDVMAVHGFGSVFGVHNSDHATVSDVSWDDIRVEHHYDRLISLRVVQSRWGRDLERGRIDNIRLRNILVNMLPYNAGYSHSLIGGIDANHRVSNVRIESLQLNGIPIRNADEIELYQKHSDPVVIA